MCLGIPGRVVALTDRERAMARVDVLGVQREVSLACVAAGPGGLDGCVGQWVLMHVGFAMSRIDEHEAQATLDALRAIGALREEREALGQTGDAAGPR